MDIQPLYGCAVGIDAHLKRLVVCVIQQLEDTVEPTVSLREFGGFQRDRKEMANWIASYPISQTLW